MHISSIFINWPTGPTSDVAFDYAMALRKEIEHNLDYFKQPIESIYIADYGQDSLVGKWLLDTSGILIKTVTFSQKAQISLEVGQKSVNEEQVELWSQMGINRIVLRYDEGNQVHIEQLGKMVTTIKRYIYDISIDLYTITPELIKAVVALPITHISLYATSGFVYAKNAVQDAGFAMYEWQHFAKAGFESIHTTNCWERKPYKGFGTGACSFDGSTRTKNVENVAVYNERVKTNQSLYEYEEQVTHQQEYIEILCAGLRKPQGVSKKFLTHSTSEKMRELIAQNFLQDYAESIGYTDRGFLVENQIISQIL